MRTVPMILFVMALTCAQAGADMPVFQEDFAGGTPGQPAASQYLTVNGNGVIGPGPDGAKCFESAPQGATGLAINGCPAEDDFNLRFAFSAGGDADNSHLYLFGSFGGGASLQIGYRKDNETMKLVVGHNGGTSGTEAVIPGLTDYNQWAMIHVLRVGRSIKVNAWKHGGKEPDGWMVDARIGAHVAGGGGLQWRFRQFRVAEIQSLPVDAQAKAQQMAAEQKVEDQVLDEADAAIEKLRKGDAALQLVGPDGQPLAGAKIQVELTRHEFLFGCNVMNYVEGLKSDSQRQAYKQRYAELFNYGTVGFYWQWFEKEQGKPDYPLNDQIVAWCQEQGIRIKGHPLLWDSWMGIPMWMGKDAKQPSPEMQKEHVQEVMRHYAGQIDFWEVVNEPASQSGLKIDQPYRWARAADPKARLIVNDYRVLDNGFPPFYELLAKARADGVPFDGIGIQAHVPENKRFPLDGVRQTLDQYARLGKELHITEFTPTSNGQPIVGSHIKGVWDQAAQADYATKFYRVCFAHPATVAITWWGFLDNEWPDKGGLLTADLQPKPAYEALKKLIHQTWHTQVQGQTDQAGRFAFRGFYGQYAVKVNGQPVQGAFRLARPVAASQPTTAPWRIQLR